MIILLVLLIVLVGALIAADRGTASLAQNTLRTKLAATLAQNGGTVQSVELEGFPFLTQVLGGKYDGMDARIVNVPLSGLELTTLTVQASDISWPLGDVLNQNLSAAVADQVDAVAVLPLAKIADPLAPRGIRLTPEGANIRVNAPASFAGFSGVVSGLATPGVSNGELTIKLSGLTVAGVPLPASAAAALSAQLARFVKSPKLPYGLKLTAVKLTGSNLVITAGARQVRLGS